MKIKIIVDIDDPFLKSEWERLEKDDSVFPQSYYHWCSTWWKFLGGRRILHIVMVLDGNDKTLAIVPLCIERNMGVLVLRSFPINYSDFYQFVCADGCDYASVFPLVHQHFMQFNPWNVVVLMPVNDHSVLYENLSGKQISKKYLSGNVVTDISANNWDAYLKSLSYNRRKRAKKITKTIEQAYAIEVEVVTNKEAYLKYFDRIHNIVDLRATKDRTRRSLMYMQCVKETNAYLFENGRMILYIIKANDLVISYRVGVLHRHAYFDWNTSYDIAYSDYSPGEVSLVYLLRDLITKGYDTIDFMAGVYDYKTSYSPKHEMRNNYMFIMRDGSIRSFLYFKYQMFWRDMVKAVYRRIVPHASFSACYLVPVEHIITKHFSDLRNRVRQYGITASGIQLVQAAFRRVFDVYHAYVFIIPSFHGLTYHEQCISTLTKDSLEHAHNLGELDDNHVHLLEKFINEGSTGICARVDGKLAGYAFIQQQGHYTFSRTRHMVIPDGYAIVKNLFIKPEFRGRGIGQMLNAARLSLIPSGIIPVGFIIPENKYAIRNWEKYGFRRVISIVSWRIFGGKWKISGKKLSESPQVDVLLKAILDSKDA